MAETKDTFKMVDPPPVNHASVSESHVKSSPILSKQDILRSLNTKPIGPVRGRPVVGAGGLKPFIPPPDGTKAVPFKLGKKVLRPPSAWSKR